MTNAGRQATAALVTGLAMAMGERARANDQAIAATGQREMTIVVHVANYAALSPPVLAGARARVAKVYAGIGVRTVWVESEDTVRPRQDSQFDLTVILLSRNMAAKRISAQRIANRVLGQAHLASGRAYIFCDRIAAVRRGAPTLFSTSTLFSISLGNVISHEMGHLLLRENSHSHKGLMRAIVDLHAIHLQNFDQAQANTIRTMLLEPTAGATAR